MNVKHANKYCRPFYIRKWFRTSESHTSKLYNKLSTWTTQLIQTAKRTFNKSVPVSKTSVKNLNVRRVKDG